MRSAFQLAAAIAILLVFSICFGCAAEAEVSPLPMSTESTAEVSSPTSSNILETQGEHGSTDGILLTEEELLLVNKAIPKMGSLTKLYYLHPESIDLSKMLATSPDYLAAQASEMNALQEKLDLKDKDMDKYWVKYRKEQVDDALMYWVGLTSDQLYIAPTTGATYLEEYDCYFQIKDDRTPSSVFRCDRGEVANEWAYLYGENLLSGERSILTMHQTNGRWYVYSHLPETIVTTEGSTCLTAAQIHQVNESFKCVCYYDEDVQKWMPKSAINCLFNMYYSCPEELNLSNLIARHPDFTHCSKEEEVALRVAGYDEELYLKYAKTDIDKTLMTYMGITSDTLYHGDKWDLVYLEEYDAYYAFYPYSGGGFTCFGGEICGNVAYLYSEKSVLTLVQRDNQWYIYAHQPLGEPLPTPTP